MDEIFCDLWQSGGVSEGNTIVFFDSECLMCNSAMRLVHQIDEDDSFRFAPLAGETARKHGVKNGETMVVLVKGELHERSEAVRVLLWSLGGIGYVLSSIMVLIPVCWRDALYDLFARNRQRISGAFKSACSIPDPALVRKILP